MSHIPEPARSTIIVSTVILFIAWIAVALRFYVRWITKLGIASDDWLILAGIVLSFITGTTYLYGIIKDPDGGANMDRDSPTFDYAPRVTYMKVSYSIAMLYFSLIGTIKISILMMYRRIFAVAVDCFRQQSLALGVIVVLWWLSGTVATAVYCVPLEQFWIGPSAGGYCWNYNIFWMAMGAIEVAIDTAILLLPVRMVWPLQLNLQNKIFVIGIFLLGGFVVVTGIARTVYGYKRGSTNVDYEHGELWSCIHVGTAIICACLPTLRPLFLSRSRLSASCRRTYDESGSRRAAWIHNARCHPRSRSEKLDDEAPPKIADMFSQGGGNLMLDGEKEMLKRSNERILVEERVDVEWSTLATKGSYEDVGLTALPKAHLGS